MSEKMNKKARKPIAKLSAENTSAKKKATVKSMVIKEDRTKGASLSIVQKKVETKAVAAVKKSTKSTAKTVKVTFQLKFKTSYGQNLFVCGNVEALGGNDVAKALPLQYFNDEFWYATVILPIGSAPISYYYILQEKDGTYSFEAGQDKSLSVATATSILLVDSWNFAGFVENAFYTEAFSKVLLQHATAHTYQYTQKPTHYFRVKAPLLQADETLCLLGAGKLLQDWSTEKPFLLHKQAHLPYFELALDLSKEGFPIAYKYGVYNTKTQQFVQYEQGNNRILYDAVEKNKTTIVHDGFAQLPNNTWKGAGVAIPVFSLRSAKSFGVGEFTDIHLLVDWSKKIGLKLIQILPINDTIATHTNKDSYPYAAISAFALHPMYLNLEQATDKAHKKLLKGLQAQQATLNSASTVDYATVVAAKLAYMKQLFPLQAQSTFATTSYQQYFAQNKHWLVPYAVFCYLRDTYQTADYNQWPAAHQVCTAEVLESLSHETAASYASVALHYFIQYHLHVQLKAATAYAHTHGIVVKGDIAIGIYRYGADAWQQPELYNMDMQAGAPPDDFAVKGQNWGFPTYNWQKMKEDGFAWWKQRFEQMSYYFDAFRIDHILGFFRIWSIPLHAVEGIMGHFVPSIPVHVQEFNQSNIWFDYHRYTQPFITDQVLWTIFGSLDNTAKEQFLQYDGYGQYTLKPAFNTQRKVAQYFAKLENNSIHQKLQVGLYDLISNVILFEVEGSNGQSFHFRFGIENTTSFQHLESHTQEQLKALYINYFFRRQDEFWRKEALQKLPALKRVTNMLICGEDLGLVPDCVPDVMHQLGLLSLEIQRMPKATNTAFFHPSTAPYLSVVTPSTHDMSTIRGWWEEDSHKTQDFYNHQLGQYGMAPKYCEPAINKAIVAQHLYAPAMWSIFQLQDLLGIDGTLRRENPHDERINIPADPNHYWCYRMHLSLEDLLQQEAFNTALHQSIVQSGRA